MVITKHNWGAFYGTELDLQLRRRGVGTIVLGGIATNFGVESTARDAYERNYALVLAEDAMTSMSADLHALAVEKTCRVWAGCAPPPKCWQRWPEQAAAPLGNTVLQGGNS